MSTPSPQNQSPEGSHDPHRDSDVHMQRIYHIVPDFMDDLEELGTCRLVPDEKQNIASDWIQVDESEWTDEQLMDDARPGRRKGNTDKGQKLRNIVKAAMKLREEVVEGRVGDNRRSSMVRIRPFSEDSFRKETMTSDRQRNLREIWKANLDSGNLSMAILRDDIISRLVNTKVRR